MMTCQILVLGQNTRGVTPAARGGGLSGGQGKDCLRIGLRCGLQGFDGRGQHLHGGLEIGVVAHSGGAGGCGGGGRWSGGCKWRWPD